MTSLTICEILWFAGLIVWDIIRYPFERTTTLGRIAFVVINFFNLMGWRWTSSQRAKKLGVARSRFGRRESGLLALVFVGVWLVPLVYTLTGWPHSLDRPIYPVLMALGAVTLGAALFVFYRSHADLGRNWSISLEIRTDHRLVTTGIYSLIRHPMYSSFFLLALAQLMLLPNWFAGLSGLVGVAMLYGFRIRQEERMMLERFGADYRRYMGRTARLIPWLRS